ncbi:hypothetical protein BT96DRAFT_990325 [Gymnopus androsaceus JB14]|uniref:Aminoglycoside phosphotransferase domain-containing protein n=1 Tax=Gymnopus androsaceus JB14 TaxID=1447944 RepID=A0A6A4I0D2_9AGAR|nr:hypothetical protein BT96DRAFT_990325 [Gymnopus androsaceus JB14]
MHFFLLLSQFLVFFSFLTVHGLPLVPRGYSHLISESWSEGLFMSKQFSSEEQKVFEPKLTGLSLGPVLTKEGHNNAGIHSVSGAYKDPHSGTTHQGETLVVKFLNPTKMVEGKNAKYGWGEVAALKVVGDYVASGMLENQGKLVPVIVMKKQPGADIHDSTAYKGANEEKKKEMRAKLAKAMCAKVAKMASEKLLYHHDNHMGNVMATLTGSEITNVNLIDYGADWCYRVKPGTSEKVLLAFCEKDWITIYYWVPSSGPPKLCAHILRRTEHNFEGIGGELDPI